ncbi:MAG: hypothetical protein M4579_002525 [Chaenotheca gracillima]|nr:MAG: hypothetical protein M4579_002525 [Chaenotheca gracillima]
MSQSTKDMLLKARKMVPPLLEKFHKGQMGRVAVIGGSEDYTGAPYFSAMASAKLGADMSHVICEPQAAQVIKTYSPNLMVHPLMRQSKNATSSETASAISKTIIDSMLSRLHVLVIGPGLGRDALMQETIGHIVKAAREQNLPFVLDADALFLAQTQPELIDGYKLCMLTPNVVEFARLAKSKGLKLDDETSRGESCKKLAQAFGGVTVIQKGGIDVISDGKDVVTCDLEGGYKRSGGQGDTLTGSLGTFLAWRQAYMDRIWDHDNSLSPDELFRLAAFAGSAMTRESSRLAFSKKGRSLQASDLTEEVHIAFGNLFEKDLSKL